MKTFKVFYMKRTSVMCYTEIEADNEIDASNKSQALIVESDDELQEMPETYKIETEELGQVTLVEDTEE